ncbi:MAG: Gfo/Idh/MocA family oxidoreductase [Planctomycetes bacterium]|nr:Gfo/Idh/MocA family oxidoreductase [Planctomycetota bacterium]
MDTPLRLLVTGCGGIAAAWLTHLRTRTDARVVGLCDLDPARAEARRAEFAPAAECGGDLAALIDRLQPDVVIDLTVPEAHAEVACLALGKGCHVLAEKPLAADMAGARRILAAAKAAGKVHAVMQNRRYLTQMVRFREAIRTRIGTPTELHSEFVIGAHFGGFREAMEHVLLLDMAIHTFDQARFLTGLDPLAVNALDWNPAGSWYRHGASALVCVEMAGGLRFTYRGSWCAEGDQTPWEARWHAIGTGGSVRWDGIGVVDESHLGARAAGIPAPAPRTGSVAVQAVRPWRAGQFHSERLPAEEAPPPAPLALESHAGCIDEMLGAIRAGGTPQTDGSDNVKSLAMVHAAIRSAEQGGARVAIADC